MNKITRKLQRQRRIRSKIHGTSMRPRLSIYRSNKSMSAQLIDDEAGKTVVGVSKKQVGEKKMTKTDLARELGTLMAVKAQEKKVKTVIFDKGSYRYHGRVKAFADAAREGGLQF